jgi:hypothetical protein
VAVDLYVDNNGNGAIDSGDLLISTDVTDGSGEYTFPGLDTTLDYLVRIDANDPAIGAHFTTAYGAAANEATGANPLAIGSGFTTVTTADFGFWRALPATIGDQVFIDNNLDGAFDPGDDPLGNVTVNLYAADGVTLVATTASDLYGHYLFDGVAAGTYIVKVDTADADIPAGFSASVLSFNPTVVAGGSFLAADFPFVSVFSKVVDKASALPDDLLGYTMSPYWPGPSLLTNARVIDNIPAGTTFASANQGGVLSGLTGSPGEPGSDPGFPGSGSVTLTAAKDTSINGAAPSLNYGADTSLTENRGSGDTLGTRPILLQFDLSGVPAGATITGAELRLTKTDATNPGAAYQIYPLLKSWEEGSGGNSGAAGAASFNQRLAATAWSGTNTAFDITSPSADFGALLAQTTVNGAGTYSWSSSALLAQVQSWYSAPGNNFGLVLGSNGSGTTDTIWNSRESSGSKPQLVVNYTGAAVPATTTAITVSPSNVADSGSGVDVTVSMTVTATDSVSGITPGPLSVINGPNGATATLVSGPTGSPASITSGGGSAVFTWIYKVFKGSVDDQVRFAGSPTGTGATFASATSNGVVVKDASASASVIWNLGSNSAAVDGSHGGLASSSGSSTLVATADTELWFNSPNSNYGTAKSFWTGGLNDLDHSVIQFDLSSIPAGAVIDSAQLSLLRKGGSGNGVISAHRVTESWVETQATWNNRATATPWATGGGSYAPVADATVTVSSNIRYSWDVTATAQAWTNGSQPNHGLLIKQANETVTGGHEFFSINEDTASRHPQLIVNYSIPAQPSTTTAISVSPVLVTDAGAGTNVSVTMTVTSAGAVSNVNAPAGLVVAGTNGANATLVSGPTGSPADIGSGGGSATFTWVYNVTAGTNPGQVTFAGAPTGNGASFGTAISHGVIVTPPLNLNVTVNNPPGVGFVENTAEFYNGPTFLAEDTAVTALSGSIGDFVWADTNADGLQDAGEVGIPGMTVLLYAADGTTQLDSTTTDSSGFYRFYGLAAGNYLVRYDTTTAPAGHFGSTPVSLAVSLSEAQQFNDADFGLYPVPSGTGSIGDFVWIDANNDGVQDGGESPLEGVAVILERRINGAWTVIGTDTTDASGLYAFTGLSAGEFRVTVDPSSQITSPYADGTFNLADVMAATYDLDDGTIAPNGSTLVTLSTNSTVVADADFGYNWSGSIGDFVWWDDNTNGQQDEDPLAGIQGARVELYHDADNDGVLNRILGDLQVGLRIVDANGYYTFQNLPPGNYIVDVYEDSFVIDGIRNVVPTTEENVVVNLAPGGMDVDTADFGYFIGARAEALVFWDENHNGIRDGGEPLLADVPVTITGLDKNGNPVDITTNSSATGYVAFLVPAGHYTISYDTAQLAALYPALGIPTTLTSFEFEAEVGEDGIRFFEFGVDNTGTIGDTIFADIDGMTGAGQGPGAGDVGLGGVTVNLYLDENGDGVIDFGAGDQLLEITTTDSLGKYLFNGLPDTSGDQQYLVEVVGTTIPAAYQQIPSSYPIGADAANNRFGTTLINGQAILIADFGYPLVPDVYYTVSGTIYDDNGNGGGTASNGTQETGEPGIENVTVTIEIDADNNGSYEGVYLVFTGPDGEYSFSAIPEGADVRITVDESTLPSTAYVQTGDPDGAPLTGIWTITNIQANASDIDFGYVEQLGSIAGTVVRGDGNGIADPGEDPVGSVTVTLTWFGPDGIPGTPDDVVSTTTTDASGFYDFTGLLPGGYEITTDIPSGLFELADRDGMNPNSINVSLGIGQNVVGRDFEYQASTLAGTVRTDTNGNGQFDVGEPAISGATVFVDLDGNGTLDPGEPSVVTDGSGAYAFGPYPTGDYQIRVVAASLPSGSIASYDPDGISSIHVATVALGINEDATGLDFGYYLNGSIGNLVWIDANHNGVYEAGTDWGINGITVQIFEAGKTPGVDDPVATQTTSGGGLYQFTDLTPGDYFVYLPTHPTGLPAVTSPSVNADNQIDNDNNGSQSVFAGPITGPVVSLDSGESDQTIDIGFACQGTWEEWRYLNPLGGQNGATDNPEGDRRDNLLEFALRGDPSSGIGDGFEIRPSTTNPGTIEAVFNRPIGAIKDMRYVLEYAATLGTPTVWGELDLSGLTLVITPISACTEQVIIPGLEAITGLTGGKGFVRIRVELDEDGDDTPEVVRHAETEGWMETGIELCCRTYNNPYLRGPLFNGTVGSVSAQQLVFPGENLDNLLAYGISYYVEVTSGDNEGHRYDVVSVSGNTITLANDTDLFSVEAPYNTVLGAPPANLAGDTVILRRHWTLAEIFPPSGFGATDSSTTADMVQMHVAGTWQLYWLYDEGDSNPATARWVKVGDNTLANQGGLVVAPGQGMFLNSRNTVSSILAYGEVRENDFRRPLQSGPNLVGGGYPLDQSTNGTGGRNMNIGAGYDGDRDFKKADRVMIWQQDTNPAGGGYDTYFLLDGSPVQPALVRWVKVGDAQIQVRDAETLFPGDRAAFYQVMADLPGDIDPAPWTP